MRGTVIGEKVVSQAQTKEFDESYDRIFGKDRKPVRGRWVYDEKLGKCVPADQYQPPPPDAINAPVLSGRFYEGQVATDGTPIDTRAKHREYMRANGITVASDYGKDWNERQRAVQDRAHAREVEATVAEEARRAIQMNQHDYDQENRHNRERREERARRSGFDRNNE